MAEQNDSQLQLLAAAAGLDGLQQEYAKTLQDLSQQGFLLQQDLHSLLGPGTFLPRDFAAAPAAAAAATGGQSQQPATTWMPLHPIDLDRLEVIKKKIAKGMHDAANRKFADDLLINIREVYGASSVRVTLGKNEGASRRYKVVLPESLMPGCKTVSFLRLGQAITHINEQLLPIRTLWEFADSLDDFPIPVSKRESSKRAAAAAASGGAAAATDTSAAAAGDAEPDADAEESGLLAQVVAETVEREQQRPKDLQADGAAAAAAADEEVDEGASRGRPRRRTGSLNADSPTAAAAAASDDEAFVESAEAAAAAALAGGAKQEKGEAAAAAAVGASQRLTAAGAAAQLLQQQQQQRKQQQPGTGQQQQQQQQHAVPSIPQAEPHLGSSATRPLRSGVAAAAAAAAAAAVVPAVTLLSSASQQQQQQQQQSQLSGGLSAGSTACAHCGDELGLANQGICRCCKQRVHIDDDCPLTHMCPAWKEGSAFKPRPEYCAHCTYPIGLLKSSMCVRCDKIIHTCSRCAQIHTCTAMLQA